MEIIIGLIGGLGLFLYGMNVMGTGLEKTAGDRMKRIIEILTNNKFMAVLVGAFVTAIVQSSSATTVMVVGFVNAGIMSLTQAVGIIMGANIGTTVTAQIVSIDLSYIAPLAIGIGVIIWIFAKNRRIKNIAEILIGFGILFIGMDFMKDAVKPLREFEGFRHMLLSFGDKNIMSIVLAIFTGFAITSIVQSSRATTGILIALASEGLLPIESAFPILLGTNIGTCVTAMISSVGANKTAKRAALVHLMFNVIGTAV
ncbi:MAG: sodium-dependent phosphate transporter, partial [Clostridiales bacterium]